VAPLRRCTECGHIRCCSQSLGKYATAHATDHPVIRSFEPGEDCFWDYRTDGYTEDSVLASPLHHPLDQPTPGPAGRVPANWQRLLTGS
jgi:hypothetical protein